MENGNSDLAHLRKFVAPEFVFGQGSSRLAGQYAHNLGVANVLLVTDEALMALPCFWISSWTTISTRPRSDMSK